MNEISLFRLYLLRGLYLIVVVGLAINVWPEVINSAKLQPMYGVVVSMLTAFSLLSIIGLRYPLQMLPICLWELFWKTLWLGFVVLPQWWSGHINPSIKPTIFACSGVVLFYLIIPWDYVYSHYVKKRGDRWV